MSDEDRRKAERAAKADPNDIQKAVKHLAAEERDGEGIPAFLIDLIGKTIWIEGARINYRGTLVKVTRYPDGSPSALILHPFERISYFGRSGPDKNTTYAHQKPHLVPWEMVHDVGEFGFVQ